MDTFVRPSAAAMRGRLALALALLLAAGSVGAQERESGAEPSYESLESPDEILNQVSGHPTDDSHLRLSLGEAIAMGLENNLNVEVARYTPRIADEQHVSAWGAYDPVGSAELGYASDDQPNSFALNSVNHSKARETSGLVGVVGLVPWLNATLGLQFDGSRTKTNSSIEAIRPGYDSSVTVTADIPLLRNLIWNPTWTAVKTTGILEESARQDFRRLVMDEVGLIETSYWNLIAREEELRVAEKSLETARALLDQTETQYEVGVVSRVEVVESKAGVAEREFNLIVAANRYKRSQDLLINEVLGEKFGAASRLEIDATDRPDEYLEYEIDLEAAVAKAFQYRPELAISENEVDRFEVQRKFTRNQMLPEFNIQSSYSASGKRGDARALCRDVVLRNPSTGAITGSFEECADTGDARPDLIGDFGDSVDDWDGANGGDTFTIRGVVSIPLGNVRARADARQSAFELRRARSALIRTRQDIILEVREKARNLASSQEGIQAAQRGQEAATEQLRAERIRLEHGESTPFDVLDREEKLVDAESQLIGAYQLYRTSVTELDRAQGTILQSRNIVIDDVAQLR